MHSESWCFGRLNNTSIIFSAPLQKIAVVTAVAAADPIKVNKSRTLRPFSHWQTDQVCLSIFQVELFEPSFACVHWHPLTSDLILSAKNIRWIGLDDSRMESDRWFFLIRQPIEVSGLCQWSRHGPIIRLLSWDQQRDCTSVKGA